MRGVWYALLGSDVMLIMHAITRQPRRRIAALSVGCGLLAVSLATRWEARVALRSIAASRPNILGRVTHTPIWRSVAHSFSTTRSSLSGIFDISSSNMANLTPPHPPPSWTHTPEEVLKLTKEAIEKDRAVQDQIAKLPASECNFDTVSATPVRVVFLFAYMA
jgi:hypothetical protein